METIRGVQVKEIISQRYFIRDLQEYSKITYLDDIVLNEIANDGYAYLGLDYKTNTKFKQKYDIERKENLYQIIKFKDEDGEIHTEELFIGSRYNYKEKEIVSAVNPTASCCNFKSIDSFIIAYMLHFEEMNNKFRMPCIRNKFIDIPFSEDIVEKMEDESSHIVRKRGWQI